VNPVQFVLPDVVHDTAQPSGGNTYDRRISLGLARLGFPIWERVVPGTWPDPDEAALAVLAEVLSTMPDRTVVLLDGMIAAAASQVLVPEASRLRLVVLVHMPFGAATDEDGLRARQHESAVLAVSNSVITTSNWTREWLVSAYGLAPARVHVAEPGVDMATSADGSKDGGKLLCVAALTPGKGHADLVTALDVIRDLPWTLSCVGSLERAPVSVEMLRRQIAELGLGDRITLHGARTGQHLSRHYRTADLLVLPSHAETYGMVVTEALAHEIPVVATDVGGVPDALGRTRDGARPGLLVPPHDPEALAGALRTWLTEPVVRRELRLAAGRRRTTLTGWGDTSRRLARVLQGAAA